MKATAEEPIARQFMNKLPRSIPIAQHFDECCSVVDRQPDNVFVLTFKEEDLPKVEEIARQLQLILNIEPEDTAPTAYG